MNYFLSSRFSSFISVCERLSHETHRNDWDSGEWRRSNISHEAACATFGFMTVHAPLSCPAPPGQLLEINPPTPPPPQARRDSHTKQGTFLIVVLQSPNHWFGYPPPSPPRHRNSTSQPIRSNVMCNGRPFGYMPRAICHYSSPFDEQGRHACLDTPKAVWFHTQTPG